MIGKSRLAGGWRQGCLATVLFLAMAASGQAAIAVTDTLGGAATHAAAITTAAPKAGDPTAPTAPAPAAGTETAPEAAASDSLSERAVPALSARVTDRTGTLTDAQRAELEQQLTALEQEKGAQVAVLLVPTTRPESIEQYATRVFDQWKLGRKNTDDGVLLIVAKADHEVRIEVGYGLEGAIPDALASRIINERMAPRFKAGDFAGGIGAAVQALSGAVRGESLPPPKAAAEPPGGAVSGFLSPTGWIIFAVVVLVGGLIMPSAVASALISGVVLHSILGGYGVAFLGAAVCGALSAVFGLLGLRKAGRPGGGGSSGRGGGGWGGGGWGGGLGGGGGGGGGFSGGGGRSGGGGASGKW